MDRAVRPDEKKAIICLVIMFTPRVMVIKMSKMGHIFFFSADDSKTLVAMWAKCLSISERSF